jgi:hypothetical protein
MKFKSALVTEASGSMGGMVASHNRFGQYFRARAVPVNPSSIYQQIIRSVMLSLASRWSDTLTDPQREAWESYAANVQRPDALGEPRTLTGLNWYIAMNVPRIQAGGTHVDVAPTIYTMAVLTLPTIVSATAATGILSIGFDNTDGWAGEIGGKLLVYTSPPQQPSVNFYRGPFRYAGAIAGAVVPPTSPLPITAAFPFAVGNRVWCQFRAIRLAGRISGTFRVAKIGI